MEQGMLIAAAMSNHA